MKKILLIGKTGQLGAEIINNANAFGFDVISFDRRELDITNSQQVKDKIEIVRPDILINTAAFHVVPVCEDRPMPALVTNFLAVGNAAKLCKEYQVKFVTYSTDYVFDGRKGAPYNEDDAPNPLQVYGFSKLAGELAVLKDYAEGSLVIRTSNLYGGAKGSPDKNGNFVLNIMKEAASKDAIEVSSEQIVNPTYACDLSVATLKLLNCQVANGVYHLASEGYCSRYEFTKEVFKLAGLNKLVGPVDRGGRNGNLIRPKFSALSNTRAKLLGIELPSWQDGLKSYFNYLKNL